MLNQPNRQRHTKPTRALCARTLCTLLCLTASVPAQEASDPPDATAVQELPQEALADTDWRAAFVLKPATNHRETNPTDSAEQSWTLVLDEQHPGEADPDPGEAEIDQARSDAWMIDAWSPDAATGPATDLAAHFVSRPLDSSQLLATRADWWARSVYSQDAELLTSLTAGREMIGWELTDGFRLAGVGSRRIWTDRTRAFIVSAEAGVRLSPHAGFQLGYELLQASAGGTLPSDLGGDAVFARFQLRF